MTNPISHCLPRSSYRELIQDLRGIMGDQINEALNRFYMDQDGWAEAVAKDPCCNMGDFFNYDVDYDDFLRAVVAEMLRRHEGK